MQPVAAMEAAETRKNRGGHLWVAMVLYAVLLVAALATLSDWRIRFVTVAIVLLFAGRTLWAPRTAAPSPLGRAVDQGRDEDEDEEVASQPM